jgi:uncharacterized membrane protein YdjX (TVP38/TMEM64 family)
VIGELPGEQWLQTDAQTAWRFGLMGGLLLASDVLLPVPSSIVGTLLGARLGFTLGLLWSFAGLCLGNAVGYALGRLLPERFVERLPRGPSLLVLFATRAVPVLAEAATLTAGAERVPVVPALLACAAGNCIYAAVLNANGAALLPEDALGLGLLIPFALPVVAYGAARLWLRRREHGPN